jgi:hypothetical protein
MAMIDADWSVDRSNKNIRYIGADHDAGVSATYATVIEFHRWLQDKLDDGTQATTDDDIAIFDVNASDRSTDNIITLLNGYNIDDTAAEHLYDGSIIQNGGDEIYDGLVVIGNSDTLQIIQNGAVLADDWWNDDSEGASLGINSSAAAGISHRFMIKVRTGGVDTDGRRLIGTLRNFGSTYSEFAINTGTARGNNVLALSELNDLNNNTASGTVATWDQFANDNEGYFSQDVNNDTTNENYYSNWDIGGGATPASPTINDLYEYAKYLTREGSASTLYGLNGELFRGITHQIALNTAGTNSGTFSAFEPVSWTGGTGQMLAIEDTTASGADTMWIQLLTGVVPGDGVLITGGTSSATATTAASNAVTERTLSTPFIGQSTGSAIIGAYGVNVDSGDLTASDRLTDLANATITPPNNVQFQVFGLESAEDRVIVAQRGYFIEYDNEATGPFTQGETLTFTSPAGTAKLGELYDQGATGYMIISEPLSGSVPADNSTISGGTSSATGDVVGTPVNTINVGQLTLNTALTIDNVTSVVVSESIPSDTPSSGTIRVQDDNGDYRLLDYSSYTGSTFTITTTNGQEDFATTNASANRNVYITYIDKVAAAATESVTVVYNADRTLFVRVRDGDSGSPIKNFETTGTLGSAGGSATAIRTSDA